MAIGQADHPETVCVIVDDMFFASKIDAAAAAARRQTIRVKNFEQLKQLAANPPALVILDLNAGRIDPLEAIEFLKSEGELKPVPVIGFVSHVQTDLIRQAQSAGCDHVLPRSAFTHQLADIVSGNLASLK